MKKDILNIFAKLKVSNHQVLYSDIMSLSLNDEKMKQLLIYLKQNNISIVNKIKKLSLEEEQLLIKKSQQGDIDARNKLVLEYKDLIYFVVNKYFKFSNKKEDLYQEGIIALIKAIMNYDFTRGYKFVTFATFIIKRELYAINSKQDSIVSFSENRYEEILKLKKVREQFFQNNGHEPSIKELAINLNVSINKAKELLVESIDNISLDANYNNYNDNSSSLINTLADFNPSLYDLYEEQEMSNRIVEIINFSLGTLDEKKRYVLIHRYGLYNEKKLKLKECAEILNVKLQRINQIEMQSLAMMRRMPKIRELKREI